MEFQEAKDLLFQKLAPSKIMALASSVNELCDGENVSCLIYNEAIYFKTDKEILERQNNFMKILMLLYVLVGFK